MKKIIILLCVITILSGCHDAKKPAAKVPQKPQHPNIENTQIVYCPQPTAFEKKAKNWQNWSIKKPYVKANWSIQNASSIGDFSQFHFSEFTGTTDFGTISCHYTDTNNLNIVVNYKPQTILPFEKKWKPSPQQPQNQICDAASPTSCPFRIRQSTIPSSPPPQP